LVRVLTPKRGITRTQVKAYLVKKFTKRPADIIGLIGDTITVTNTVAPVYNFKGYN